MLVKRAATVLLFQVLPATSLSFLISLLSSATIAYDAFNRRKLSSAAAKCEMSLFALVRATLFDSVCATPSMTFLRWSGER